MDFSTVLQRHHALMARLQDTEFFSTKTKEQRDFFDSWLQWIEQLQLEADKPLRIVFLASVGAGKTTLISALSGLHLAFTPEPEEWSVLPVGHGRTTLGEVRIQFEERADLLLEVEPISQDRLELEVRLFAEDLFWKKHRKDGASGGAGEELHTLLRTWLAPKDHSRAELDKLASEADSEEELTTTLLERLPQPGRFEAFCRNFPATELASLQDVLGQLMVGTLSGAPAPQTTTLRIPRPPDFPVALEVIDTQGVDLSLGSNTLAARSDLQKFFRDPDALFVIGTAFKTAPDTASLAILKAIQEGTQQQQRLERTHLIVIDDRSGKHTEQKKQKGEERLEQCRDLLRRSEEAGSFPPEQVFMIDVRQKDDQHRLKKQVASLVTQERDRRIESWNAALSDVEQSLAKLPDPQRLRMIELKLRWAWEAHYGQVPDDNAGPMQLLGNAIERGNSAIHHWSHVYAAVRRDGHYEKLDLLELAETLVTITLMLPLLSASIGATEQESAWYAAENEEEAAHLSMRGQQLIKSGIRYAVGATRQWETTLRKHFESEPVRRVWNRCAARWGGGPGYIQEVSHWIRSCPEPVLPTIPEPNFHPHAPFDRLQKITLQNFRCIENGVLSIPTTGRLLLFVGSNGSGKTTWIEGFARGLRPMIEVLGGQHGAESIESSVRKTVQKIGTNQTISEHTPLKIEVQFFLQGQSMEWCTGVNTSYAQEPITNIVSLQNWAQEVVQDIEHNRPRPLPLLVYYSTNRLWSTRLTVDATPPSPPRRIDGYKDCLAAKASHQALLQGMYRMELIAWTQRKEVDFLVVINKVIASVIEGAARFYYNPSLGDLCLEMKTGEVQLFSQLSDGYQNMVALVANIAWRCCLLNPQFSYQAARFTEGVVLIDEVDLHLHPRWQREVLPNLLRAFPRLFFICTTHSPQVVSSVEPECIQLLQADGSIQQVEYTKGVDSNTLLRRVFDTLERPQETEDALNHIHTLLEEGHTDEARAEIQKMERQVGEMDARIRALRWELAEVLAEVSDA